MPEPPVEASPTLQRIGLVLGPLPAAVVLLASAPDLIQYLLSPVMVRPDEAGRER
jgi:hypothetical protein